jgi:hypothetical protein
VNGNTAGCGYYGGFYGNGKTQQSGEQQLLMQDERID